MSTNPISPPAPATPPPVPIPVVKKTRWPLYVLGAFLAFLLVIVASVALTLWWLQRPIKPVVLSAPEKAAVEAKLHRLDTGKAETPSVPVPDAGAKKDEVPILVQDRPYEAGGKAFILTEREINGLLNANTELGDTVRLEFARDAINAYLVVPIPEDFPIGGGKMFRARGRFRLSLSNDQAPFASLEDVTVFGVSLPKAWLGGIKGENLISEAMGKRDGKPVFKGIKSLRIEPGALVIEVEN